jgi:excisionase family DNA binding protein
VRQNDERRLFTGAASSTSAADHNAGGGDRLLTAAELGDYLGLSASTVLDRWQAGDLPGFKLWGRRGPVRFRASDIEAFLEGCRVEARAS